MLISVKPGDGVDLVDVDLSGAVLQEEIEPGHPRAFDGPVGFDGQPPDLADRLRREGRPGSGTCFAVQVFVAVVVEIPVGDDLAGERRPRLIVPEDAAFDLPASIPCSTTIFRS